MTTQKFTDGVTLTAASWFDDVDTASYSALTTVAGTANAITAVGPASMTAYAARLRFWFIPPSTNTGALTIALTCNSVALGTRSVFSNGSACVGGEARAGIPLLVMDDGTRFHIIGGGLPHQHLRRNRLKNAGLQVDQRVNSATSRADDVYGIDCWYTLTQTAAITVTQQTLQENGQPYNIRLTQSQAGAQRMGVAQIVEARDSQGDRGRVMTLSSRIRCSSAQAIRYAILEWTGTADTVTSDVVLDWTSSTYTANNFFLAASLTVTGVGSITPTANTWTDITALTGTAGSSLNNWVVLVWTEGTAAQNVTLDVGVVQLEPGPINTDFETRTYEQDWRDAQRLLPGYQSKSVLEPVCISQSNSNNQQTAFFTFIVTPRIPPTGATVSNGATHFQGTDGGGAGKALTTVTFSAASLTGCDLIMAAAATPWTAGQIGHLIAVSASGQILFGGAEL